MKVQRRYTPQYFPWMTDNDWQIVCFCNTIEDGKKYISDQNYNYYYEYRITE